ncbi:hypothetical protein N8328_05490 [Crocinitomicaceae bacterium]|nr:hypothetical protein [Crocinitomicaceae bacterium]
MTNFLLKITIAVLIIASPLIKVTAQDGFKTAGTIGKSYNEINNAFGNYYCKETNASKWFCFYGEDNSYDCISTLINFTFSNNRVKSFIYMWEHSSYSLAMQDVNYETTRLAKIYGRPEYKSGSSYFLINNCTIISTYTFQNGKHYSTLSFIGK